MENAIQSFTNTEFGELDILQEGDKFWFPATQCARVLGYSNPYDAIQKHCKEYGLAKREGVFLKRNKDGSTMEQANLTNYISEGNLYRLICRSKLESAERFEYWVFEEVLPSIRKHGAYIVPELLSALSKSESRREELVAELEADRASVRSLQEECSRLLDAQHSLEEECKRLSESERTLQATIEVTQPKASYYDLILENPEAVPVTLIAKDYGYPAHRFNSLLHGFGLQYPVGGTWELYQKYADNGYTHNNVYVTKSGRNKVHMCWTQAGRLFLYDFLKKEGILPKIEQPRQEAMV